MNNLIYSKVGSRSWRPRANHFLRESEPSLKKWFTGTGFQKLPSESRARENHLQEPELISEFHQSQIPTLPLALNLPLVFLFFRDLTLHLFTLHQEPHFWWSRSHQEFFTRAGIRIRTKFLPGPEPGEDYSTKNSSQSWSQIKICFEVPHPGRSGSDFDAGSGSYLNVFAGQFIILNKKKKRMHFPN